jgi:hypothetical protein
MVPRNAREQQRARALEPLQSRKPCSRRWPVRKIARAFLTVSSLVCVIPAYTRGDEGGATEEEAFGPEIGPGSDVGRPKSPKKGGDEQAEILRWNQIAVDATGLDHTPVTQGPPHTFGQQLGPARSSRAMAIVHIAMFEADNAVHGHFRSYIGLKRTDKTASVEAAIAQAAHDTLVALFSSQTAIFDAALAEDLQEIADKKGRASGIAVGQAAAAAILAIRKDDGSATAEPLIGTGPGQFATSNAPGKWRKDPIGRQPIALGAFWSEVDPFVMKTADQFRPPPPPALTSAAYATAYAEVKRLGGDGAITPTQRTPEQTQIGIFWAYDGTPSLCAPPRLYNQITVTIAAQQKTTGLDLARLLALVNVSLADAAISVWEAKYFYQLWRPITGIRESDPGTGPTQLGDGNPSTIGDPTFMPLGAPASNLSGPNFTPPFPAYPSGHAGFGGALFEVLRKFYGTDKIHFTFVSDELNGVTLDNNGHVRPLVPRQFDTLSQAEEENGQSRIYLGIHWAYDKTEGIAEGERVADFVINNLFAVRDESGNDGDSKGSD